MRALEKIIPFRPVLGDLTARVHDDEGVLPTCIDALFAAPFLVRVLGQISRSSSPWQAGHRALRRVPERHFRRREGQARPDGGDRSVRRPSQGRELSALGNEHAIRTLRKDALYRSPGPVLVPRQRSKGNNIVDSPMFSCYF